MVKRGLPEIAWRTRLGPHIFAGRLLFSAGCLGVCVGYGLWGQPLFAQGNGTKEEAPEWVQSQVPLYEAADKPDPFASIIRQREAQQSQADSEKRDRPLTPLEKVEVSQLRLVGVIVRPGEEQTPLAMVELPNGKGYLLQPGTKIGNNQGRVVTITPDSVLVRETVVDVFGETQARTVTLKLHPGGGEEDEDT